VQLLGPRYENPFRATDEGVSVSRRREVAPCCALDEGRPLGVALQEETSNHHERLLFNGGGRERHGQKARLDRVRYG
jgi:hypothetical protein